MIISNFLILLYYWIHTYVLYLITLVTLITWSLQLACMIKFLDTIKLLFARSDQESFFFSRNSRLENLR